MTDNLIALPSVEFETRKK